MHERRSAGHLCAGLMLLLSASAHADSGAGLAVGDRLSSPARGTTRLDLGVLQSHTTLSLQSSGVRGGRRVRVLGNYYFDGVGIEALESALPSGFRASSGLLLTGQRADLLGSPFDGAAGESPFQLRRAAPTSYIGLGYTSSLHRSGWGFSADLGLTSATYGASSDPYASPGGNQTLDDVLHTLRLSPLLQLDVNYAF